MNTTARIGVVLLFAMGTAAGEDSVFTPPSCQAKEAAFRDAAALLRCRAPVFVLELYVRLLPSASPDGSLAERRASATPPDR